MILFLLKLGYYLCYLQNDGKLLKKKNLAFYASSVVYARHICHIGSLAPVNSEVSSFD